MPGAQLQAKPESSCVPAECLNLSLSDRWVLAQDAGAAPPDYDAIAATPGVVPSPYATNGSTLWFSWGNEASFPSQEAALAAFQDFLTTVGPWQT